MIRTLMLFSAIVAVASAGTVSSPFSELAATNFTPATGLLSASISNGSAGSYSLTGTACFDGYCQGQVPGGGPTYPVNDPLTLRLTGLTLTCNTTDASCGSITIGGFFNWSESAGGTSVSLNLDGTSSNPTQSMSIFGSVQGTSFLNVPSTGVTASGGVFNSSIPMGAFTLNGSLKANLGLTITLAKNDSISLPNSLSLVFATGAPEPGTLAIAVCGLFAIGFLRRKR